MGIRGRTYLTVTAVVVLLWAGLYASVHFITIAGAESRERQEVSDALTRVSRVVSMKHGELDRISLDWAKWDDAYDFMDSRSPAFIKSNLSSETASDLGISWMLFDDEHGKRVFTLAASDTPVPPALDAVASGGAENSDSTWLVNGSDGPVLYARRPITRTDGSGPPRGWIDDRTAADFGR